MVITFFHRPKGCLWTARSVEPTVQHQNRTFTRILRHQVVKWNWDWSFDATKQEKKKNKLFCTAGCGRFELSSLTAWGEKLLCDPVVRQRILLYLCQTTGWTDCCWAGCCLLVSFRVCADILLHWYHWCSVDGYQWCCGQFGSKSSHFSSKNEQILETLAWKLTKRLVNY